tara:strand:- start:2106 stop:4832 length:2727 start_codon:yes stop_codon:yes gene_type:complete
MATGDASGTWGTITNTNLELIGEALGFGTEAITTNADTHTSTIADGASDGGSANDGARAMYLKYTGTLDSACTITIAPNDIRRLQFIENGTSGSQNIIISQGSGANVTITPGTTKAVYLDGAGSGAAVVDAFAHIAAVDLTVDDDLIIGDDLTFSSDSAVITFGADADTTLTHTDGSGLTLNSTNKIMFNDASQFIHGSSATVLSLGATNEIDLTATAVDLNGTLTISGDTTIEAGADLITATAGTSNVRIGANAGDAIQSGGDFNIVIGDEAGTAITTGDSNIAIGHGAGDALTTGTFNVAVGHLALSTEDAHSRNTAIGYQSLKTQDAGANAQNTAVGYNSGTAITTGLENTFIGASAGETATNPSYTTAVGKSALGGGSLSGSYNTAVGRTSGIAMSSGANNTLVGYASGEAITTGANNTFIGSAAGDANTTASDGTAVGHQALSSNTTALYNTAVGFKSLFTTVTGAGNTAVGWQSLLSNTGDSNVAIGMQAMQTNTSGGNNVAIGRETLLANTSGASNTGVGGQALDANTTGNNNTGIGQAALGANTTGSQNVAVGMSCMVANTTGNDSIAMGVSALAANTTGSNIVALGRQALQANTTASGNVAVGLNALNATTTGSSNTAVGQDTGKVATTAVRNTFIGQTAGESIATSSSDNTFVGQGAGNAITSGDANTIIGRFTGNMNGLDIRTTSNNIVIADGDGVHRITGNPSGNIGIGDTSNVAKLMVQSNFSLFTGINVKNNNSNNAGAFLNFSNSAGAQAGSIAQNDATGTAYNTSSDYRLKENVSYSFDATSRLKQLKPARFNFIVGSGTTVDGFIAHEVSSIIPEAITGTKDGTRDVGTVKDADGNVLHENVIESAKEDGQTWTKTATENVYQQIDQSKIVPLLVKTIQELEARITTLEGA